MSRVQLALRVADLEAAIGFYSKLFGAEPAKRRPGYANFAISEPPLKLVLIEGEAGEPTRLDHLGVDVGSTQKAWRRQPRTTVRAAMRSRTRCGSRVRAVSRGRCTRSRPTRTTWPR